MTLNRREFVQLAGAMGASLAWGGSARASTTGWHERRDLYPEGVASGDPDPSSVILWTRRPFESGEPIPVFPIRDLIEKAHVHRAGIRATVEEDSWMS